MNSEANSRNAQQEVDPSRFRAPVTDRVNVEPAILRGMTVTEAKVITLVTVPIFLVLGGILLMMTGYWQFVLVLGMLGPLCTLWLASGRLQKIKRGRPDGYYTQAIHIWLAKRGLTTNQFLSHHGQWDLGRSLDLNLAHPFDPKEKSTKSQSTQKPNSQRRTP